jgi:hypothetical protein
MQYPINYLFIWESISMSFKTQSARNLLCDFLENEDNYCMAIEDFGSVLDLNLVSQDRKLADDLYLKFRPELKNALQSFLESGK